MSKKSHKHKQKNSLTSKKHRQVDTAMADERPAKIAIRELWLKQVKEFNDEYPEDDVPLYLTLSGSEARDIKLLAENGIIKLTEIGAISQEFQSRVVAIEQNPQAVLTLQKKMPGLQIVDKNFGDLIKGVSPLSFPTNKKEIEYCCAKIVNLDLQSNLVFKSDNAGIIFPVFNWIEKISLLHSQKKPNINWCLYLTLNAAINQPEDIGGLIQNFLKENYLISPNFELSCRNLLGDNIQDSILSDKVLDLSQFTWQENQKILMIFVPKKISNLVYNQSWHVKTLWNLCYGGNQGHAPMVSWILYFQWDERTAATPQAVYTDSLNKILSSVAKIEDDGQLTKHYGD